MALGETCLNKEKGITRWFQKLRKNLYKNSIYFALLVHPTPDDVLVVRNILSFYTNSFSVCETT
jgi:hypothetical protein